jgi:hypothetical protein
MQTKLFAVIAVLWLCLVTYAESQCATLSHQLGIPHHSYGNNCTAMGIFWFIPMLTAPVGGFAILGVILIALVSLFRRFRN